MSAQRGFTLVEVLVATAILALALGAFITGGARHADYARYIHDRTLGQYVARNQLVEYQVAEQWPGTGNQDGDTDLGAIQWRWVAEISESPDPGVRRVDIRVFRIDTNTNKPAANSTALLSGFVTQHIEAVNAPTGEGDNPDADDADDYGSNF